MNILELLLGQIPEAVFVALFMVFSKNIKTKRIIFLIITVVDYVLLIYTFKYNWGFHILFMIITYIILKVLYKERTQIVDIFIFAIAYIYIIITSFVCVIFTRNVVIASIINRLLLFIPLFVLNYKLSVIQSVYKKYWNRNDKIKKKMKSVTFRSLNIVIFNLLFVIINIGMLVATYYNNFIK